MPEYESRGVALKISIQESDLFLGFLQNEWPHLSLSVAPSSLGLAFCSALVAEIIGHRQWSGQFVSSVMCSRGFVLTKSRTVEGAADREAVSKNLLSGYWRWRWRWHCNRTIIEFFSHHFDGALNLKFRIAPIYFS